MSFLKWVQLRNYSFGVFLFPLRTSYDSNGVKSPAGNKRWAGLHLTASPADLNGYSTSYKDNGDRQPYNDRTLPSGALVQDQLLEWMKAYHLWDTYDKKTTLRVYP
jgi:hypothetical protein